MNKKTHWRSLQENPRGPVKVLRGICGDLLGAHEELLQCLQTPRRCDLLAKLGASMASHSLEGGLERLSRPHGNSRPVKPSETQVTSHGQFAETWPFVAGLKVCFFSGLP